MKITISIFYKNIIPYFLISRLFPVKVNTSI